eukprot:GFUD01086440.1.p1 GENE.GFUD01086440.1~~GFUD01086440.1.p1  ORF type:complete len:393 (-),score=51.63 GFUD01086440.1:46-1113(-)
MTHTDYVQHMQHFFAMPGKYDKLKHIFLTHPDADHINFGLYSETIQQGLLRSIVDHYGTQPPRGVTVHFGSRDGWEDKRWFRYYVERHFTAVFHEKENPDPVHPVHPDVWQNSQVDICDGNDFHIKIIAADLGKKPNERSMVMSLRMNNKKKMLFFGDFEGETPLEILMGHYEEEIKAHEVMMVPHHGSDTNGNGHPLLYDLVLPVQTTKPLAVISSGIMSNNHHPKAYVLAAICEQVITEFPFPIQTEDRERPPMGRAMCWQRQNVNNEDQSATYAYDIHHVYEDQCTRNVYQTTKINFPEVRITATTLITTLSNTNARVTECHAAMREDTRTDTNTEIVYHAGKIGTLNLELC